MNDPGRPGSCGVFWPWARFLSRVGRAACLRGRAGLLLVLVCGELGTSTGALADFTSQPYAVLRRLDKITARTSEIELRIGEPVTLGTLTVEVKICHRSDPEDSPENVAFLDIYETREGGSSTLLFRGWMFSSSPALSALEHSIYDIWLLSCRKSRTGPAEKSVGN